MQVKAKELSCLWNLKPIIQPNKSVHLVLAILAEVSGRVLPARVDHHIFLWTKQLRKFGQVLPHEGRHQGSANGANKPFPLGNGSEVLWASFHPTVRSTGQKMSPCVVQGKLPSWSQWPSSHLPPACRGREGHRGPSGHPDCLSPGEPGPVFSPS